MARTFRTAAALALIGLFAAMALLLPGTIGPARADAAALSGGITGPSDVGLGLKASYVVSASGGPAEAANGTQVGTYSYKATLTATNTSGAAVTPSTGVLVNGSISLQLIAPNVSESLTIFVLVTSSYQTKNTSQNFSFTVSIVEPYRLNAQIVVGPAAGVSAFALTVTLDGSPVGTVSVPTLSAAASYPVTFSYVNPSLAPGWHTFAISLAQEHGLVTFYGGAEQVSQSFYVPGPTPDYSFYYLLGAVAFVGVVFIWSMRVGARRRRPKK